MNTSGSNVTHEESERYRRRHRGLRAETTKTTRRRGFVTIVAAALVALPLTAGVGQSSTADAVTVSDRSVGFTVVNRDRNNPRPPGCPTDNKAYTVKGHITGPADELSGDGPKSAVLFAHGHGFTEELWRYKGAGGAYDTAGKLAELGHTSVTYDRLGYGASGLPVGTASWLLLRGRRRGPDRRQAQVR